MSGDWPNAIRERLHGVKFRFDAPLKQVTTLRIGGAADCLAEPEDEAGLEALFGVISEFRLPFLVLGKGSNVLIPDAGLRGVALRLGKGFQQNSRSGDQVWAGAGGANAALVEKCRRWGLGGLEFLIAVPGTVGGAIAMNAGAHGGDTGTLLQTVRYLEIGTGMKQESSELFHFGYRDSPLKGNLGKVVVGGEFSLVPAQTGEIEEKIAYFQNYRREKQPRDFPNCGSVFKNPPEEHAAKLIEGAGLKGTRVGGAQVSEKHANFIVNRGEATAADVLGLIDIIREKVYTERGITLELELQVL